MAGDEAIGRRQAQPAPLPHRPGREKGLEDPGAGGFVHAAAVVLHLDHQFATVLPRPQDDAARTAAQGLGGVVEQGLQGAAEQRGIDLEHRQAAIVALQHLAGLTAVCRRCDHPVEKLGHRHRSELQRPRAGQALQHLDDIADPLQPPVLSSSRPGRSAAT
jgi:hypothetical protein